MKSNMATCAVAAIAVVAANMAVAAEVSRDDAAKAAAAFVSSDAVGSAVLNGRSVANIAQRGSLWIASLSPSGHIVLSGSDIADPIVGFSKNDFTEPDPESPAFAVLESAEASVVSLEVQGGTRHARWTRLLGGGVRGFSTMADNPSSSAVVVQPFLAEHYNQWQPYNDYAPVHQPDESKFVGGYEPYRGRCPCGCVATASAQIFHHFRWPARIDYAISVDHVFEDDGGLENTFPIRFDGRAPICWDAISNDYVCTYWKGGKTYYDLRGGVAEAVRYPIARLILWCDVIAHMSFKSSGSSANYRMVAGNVGDCYTPGRWVQVASNADYSQVVSDLQAGIPLQVGLDGHQVVGHGWAEDGTSKYIYLNYGWGGGSDGYYNMDNSTIDLPIQEIFVGHYPRAKPQIDPLPKVSETGLTLNWHFPDFYTNNLSGFTVSIARTTTTPSTFLDDFSASSGRSSSSEGIYTTSDSAGCDGDLLLTKANVSGTYAFPDSYTLTSASVLTFKLYSFAALGASYTVEARFNWGAWTTLCTPVLKSDWAASGWSTERVYLGSYGGQIAQFRIRNSHSGAYYPYDESRILLDDFTVTDVLAPVEPEMRNVGKAERSLTLDGLAAGATYSFTVAPELTGALVEGESSESVTTSIAGSRKTPLPGEQTYTPTTLSFSTSDTSGTWSYNGTATSSTSISDYWDGTVSARLQGALSAQSVLSFSWMAKGYYSGAYDTFSAVFMCNDGTDYDLWSMQNTTDITSAQPVSVSLAAYAGKSGKIKISYSHSGSQYTYDGYGGTLSDVQVTNVQVPIVPAVAWDTQTLTSLGMPEILSVSAVAEGFYGECGTNASSFTVACSSTVDSLQARPSHLALVKDSDVTVTKTGNGTFRVSLTPSGVNADNLRSRMILTLIASDANGTKCYKDLSLRFSEVAQAATEVVVSARTAGGVSYSVAIPYSWIEANGLASSGSDAAAHEAAVSGNADADSDGLPNWAEYICGTSPTNPAEKVTASIAMENGKPVVTYTPADSQIAPGFKAVIKGAPDLSTAFSSWEVVTETRTSTCKFFRVEIVPEN